MTVSQAFITFSKLVPANIFFPSKECGHAFFSKCFVQLLCYIPVITYKTYKNLFLYFGLSVLCSAVIIVYNVFIKSADDLKGSSHGYYTALCIALKN
jgi:hypothetical protein